MVVALGGAAGAAASALPRFGDRALGLNELIDPLRWHNRGVSETDLRESVRPKARMESERLPKGADPLVACEMGRGGLSDVGMGRSTPADYGTRASQATRRYV